MTVIAAATGSMGGPAMQAGRQIVVDGSAAGQDFLKLIASLVQEPQTAFVAVEDMPPSGLEPRVGNSAGTKAKRGMEQAEAPPAEEKSDSDPQLNALLILPVQQPPPILIFPSGFRVTSEGGAAAIVSDAASDSQTTTAAAPQVEGSASPSEQPSAAELVPQLALRAVLRAKVLESPLEINAPSSPPKMRAQANVPTTSHPAEPESPIRVSMDIRGIPKAALVEPVSQPEPPASAVVVPVEVSAAEAKNDRTLVPAARVSRAEAEPPSLFTSTAHSNAIKGPAASQPQNERRDDEQRSTRAVSERAAAAAPARTEERQAEVEPARDDAHSSSNQTNIAPLKQLVVPAESGRSTPPPQAGSKEHEPPLVRESSVVEVQPTRTAGVPVREISVRIADTPSSNVDLRVVERGGRVVVDIRSSDASLTQALRENSNDLVNRLDASGFRTEQLTHEERVSTIARSEMNGTRDSDGGGRGDRPSEQGRASDADSRQRRPQQTWADYADDQINEPIPTLRRNLWPAR